MSESTVVTATPVQIFTTAPIPLTELKRKFSEDVEFIIDYDNSKYKGKILITYLSNLAIKCKIKTTDFNATMQLLEDYLKIPSAIKINDLEELAMHMLLAYTGKPHGLDFDPQFFFDANSAILDTWVRRLYSTVLYAIKAGGKHENFLEHWPEDTDNSPSGINFVNLIQHPLFGFFIENVPKEKLTWNKNFFEEYVFAGSNMFSYFTVDTNPLWIALIAIQSPESAKQLNDAIISDQQFLSSQLTQDHIHVPSL